MFTQNYLVFKISHLEAQSNELLKSASVEEQRTEKYSFGGIHKNILIMSVQMLLKGRKYPLVHVYNEYLMKSRVGITNAICGIVRGLLNDVLILWEYIFLNNKFLNNIRIFPVCILF